MADCTPTKYTVTSTSIIQSRGFVPGLVAGGVFAGVLFALVSVSTGHRGEDTTTTDTTARTFEAISSMQESLGQLATDLDKVPGEGDAAKEIGIRVAALTEMNSNLYQLVADLGKNSSQGDTAAEHAHRAEQRAQELRESDPELASILYLNAFNTNPENAEPLLAYVDLMAGAGAPVEQVNQVIAMLDVALYRVAPDSVERVQEKKTSLESISLSTAPDAGGTLAPTDLAATVETLMSQESSLLVADEGQLEAFIQEAEYVLEQLELEKPEADSPSRMGELTEKLAMLRRCQDALQLAHSAEIFAGRAEAFVQSENSRLATMLLNSAENSAVQAVSMCDPNMPAALIERTSSLMARLDGLSSMISDRQSALALEKIRSLSSKLDSLLESARTFEARCDIVEKLHRDCQPYAAEITAADARSEALKLLTFTQEKLSEFRREQYTAYNHWALERCQIAAASIRQEWFKTSEDAVKVFGESEVAKIDPTIISPETGRVYNQVVERLMGEMAPEVVAEHEKHLTLTQKIRLENF